MVTPLYFSYSYRFIINLENGNKKTKNYTGDCSLLDCQKNLPIRTEKSKKVSMAAPKFDCASGLSH